MLTIIDDSDTSVAAAIDLKNYTIKLWELKHFGLRAIKCNIHIKTALLNEQFPNQGFKHSTQTKRNCAGPVENKKKYC